MCLMDWLVRQRAGKQDMSSVCWLLLVAREGVLHENNEVGGEWPIGCQKFKKIEIPKMVCMMIGM